MGKSWGKCDFKQLKDLQKKIEKIERMEFEKMCNKISKELAARLLAKVIKRTPVGKKPKLKGPKTEKVQGSNGKSKTFLTAEGAWLEKYWSDYSGGQLRRAWTVDNQNLVIEKIGNMYQLMIVNNTEYASYVEYGHRQMPGRFVPALGKRLKQGWVEGQFILTKSEQELDSQAPAIVDKIVEQFLKGAFNEN